MATAPVREKAAVVRYDGTIRSLRNAIELCDGFESLNPHQRILLKPNIVWGGTPKLPPFGVVTTSVLVDHLLQLLRDKGCRDIAIGEGTVPNSELRSSTYRGYRWSGIERVARRYGVPLIDFNSERFEQVSLGDIQVDVSRWALQCDFLINMPVLKTHRQTKVSLGMKNLKGCLGIGSKKKFHKHDLSRLIALLNARLKSSLTIIDGIYALEGGPDFLGTSHRTNLLIAGRDVLSGDIVGAEALGIRAEEVDHIRELCLIDGRSPSPGVIELK